MIAYSGTIKDSYGSNLLEHQINNLKKNDDIKVLFREKYDFLIVVDKFQTGFDEPSLNIMCIDKKLSGIQTVQTLSRLNRYQEYKTYILDFKNEAENIKKGF